MSAATAEGYTSQIQLQSYYVLLQIHTNEAVMVFAVTIRGRSRVGEKGKVEVIGSRQLDLSRTVNASKSSEIVSTIDHDL